MGVERRERAGRAGREASVEHGLAQSVDVAQRAHARLSIAAREACPRRAAATTPLFFFLGFVPFCVLVISLSFLVSYSVMSLELVALCFCLSFLVVQVHWLFLKCSVELRAVLFVSLVHFTVSCHFVCDVVVERGPCDLGNCSESPPCDFGNLLGIASREINEIDLRANLLIFGK